MPGSPVETLRQRFAETVWQAFRRLPGAGELLDRVADADGVYLVGGAVRDLALGRVPLDLDLVVEGEPGSIVERIGAPIRVHDRFGTCSVMLGGVSWDVAQARRERYPHPGALPIVAPATIDEDLRRRDFTVNALAIGLAGTTRGRIVAAPGGPEDLHDRLLRVLHDASFIDDPTRLLRLARYRSRLAFEVEPATRALAAAAVGSGALRTVSSSRLGAELRLLVAEPDPVHALVCLHELDIDDAIAPGFGLHDSAQEGLARRALALLPADGDPADLALAVAAADVAPARLSGLLDELEFTAARRERIVVAARRAGALATALAAADRPSQIAIAAARAPVELVALAGALGPDRAARSWLERLRKVKLSIDGDDLLAAGVASGPAVGAGLAAARAAKLDGRAQGREDELATALRAAADHNR